MDLGLQGKRALVTGSSAGIGAAIAVALAAEGVNRRERWQTPRGETVVAELPPGVIGGCGPHLHRLVLMLHFQGQMTCERIVTLLTGAGVAISKRQAVRLLTAKLDAFRAEDEAVFHAGLCASPYVTVDDTGDRHAGKAGYTMQFGSDRFTTFRTGTSKSRLAFLRNLLGGAARYAINAAALAYMRAGSLAQRVIDKLSGAALREFACDDEWRARLNALGVSALKVAPDPVRVACEAALWGAIHADGRLADCVIVSDDAGQFRVGDHALCWVHAERLVHKLIPANDRQRNGVEVAKRSRSLPARAFASTMIAQAGWRLRMSRGISAIAATTCGELLSSCVTGSDVL